MDEFVEELARGNVIQVKVVLASVVMVLAAYQVLLMAVTYGKLKVPFLNGDPAAKAHRAIGDSIVTIAFFVAFMCLAYFEVEDGIEHASDGETTRAAIHTVAAFLLLGVIALKVVVVRWWHSAGRFLPLLGLSIFGLFLVTWLSSAGDYIWGW